ncbi:efflux RND transporter permease subunit [Helcobacillus massiliensis]|uniref:MMPL family transporter n=1 Tax=Helcobacillus TaxID=1161125 RepID=UPI001EF50217|nr:MULTISPECIES: efflux RND transporter permease subunit [Helcobacillus]MCG7428111.1 efflux RND transporter permease subunit [Helcobacillus sp. ACRRO]MCT1558176.1 efflux RND transporter permease subunit [Helcobacillus massiliensis]MCT2036469.1 efflux RND transporter permease subunit [Helcobacillus massiliensis]MCT2332273.1 efflux RND transporter permease subunit [Helcobacillus massiliensis]
MSPHRASRRTPSLRRLLIPALLTLAWLTVFAFGGMSFGSISDVSTNDRSTFLPESAESTRVQEEITRFTGSDAIPAIVIAERPGGITKDDTAALTAARENALAAVPGAESSPVIPSEDGEAAQLVVTVPSDQDIPSAVETIRAAVQERAPSGLDSWVSGPAAFTAELTEAFAGIDGLLLIVALAVVLIILVAVYRSPLLPLIVLLSSLTALCAAVLINVALARAGALTITGQVQGILFILVIGAATDYSLLFVARYREMLRDHASAASAALATIREVAAPIIASAGTVIAGLLCLMLSDLRSNAALGPVASIGIACSVLATLTFLPALLALFGRVAVWPRAPEHGSAHPVLHGEGARGFWARLGAWVERGPKRVAAGVALLLAAGCAGLVLLDADGVPQSSLVLGDSSARDGQAVIDEHFAGGSGSPTYVLAPADRQEEVAQAIAETDGVDSVAIISQESPSGTLPIGDDGTVQTPPPGAGPPGAVEAEPTVLEDRVMFSVTLDSAADSLEAEQTIIAMRDGLNGTDAAVGGTTAVDLDTNDTSAHDRSVIIPIVLVVITVMLGLLLRAIVAPLVLLATTVLSFGTALGISAVIFHLIGQGKSDPSVPLYAFVFLVALGIDYNIFLMTRVREESVGHGTHVGTLRGLAVTGGVITNAGIVLAATFAALLVLPIQFLLQLAIIVALGVLIDALVVRALLVPALALWIGDAIWWPSPLARGARDAHRGDSTPSGRATIEP